MAEEDSVITENESDDSQQDGALLPAKDILPDTLLIIPLYDRPMFPKMMGPIMVEDKRLQMNIKSAQDKGVPIYLGLLLVKPNESAVAHAPRAMEDFYEVGVAARVVQITPPSGDQPMQLVAQAQERYAVKELIREKPIFQARVTYLKDEDDESTEELKAYSVAIIDCIKELVNLNPLFKEGLSLLLERINVSDPSALADFSASMTTSSGAELQAILETVSVQQRLERVLILLKKEIEISKLKADISKRIEERLSKQQREFFLKQQLKEIKKELGIAKDDTQSELEKFEKRLKTLNPSEEGKTRINEELEKLKLLEPSSAEFNVTRAYLDWLTVLPWGVYTEDNYDLTKARKILDQDHFGLEEVKERILELLSVGIIKGDLAGSIILLVGPPGVGKTSIGQSIARSVGREFYRFSLGGMRDEAEIKGHRRTYIGALPGKFIQAMKTCKTANPLIMLDEIDKIGASFRGDPASALLEVLDPEQNRDFLDHYIDVRFDLSKVLFICTANQLETIPGPLIDRMEMIQLPGYIQAEKVEIARRHLIPKQLKLHGLTKSQVSIAKPVIAAIADGYAREAGVRNLENRIKKILRKVAKDLVSEPDKQVKVKISDLPELLGKKSFSDEKIFSKPRVGVVTGLAYTAMGGTTLHIEAAAVPSGSPGFKQTGQLGQVMVESSEIAYSYVRSLFSKNKALLEFFKKHFIHLHVPAGATPKDGPSAGITMACALYSLATATPMVANTAMTGELTLTGLVMPIGGVKEKVIAATRAKVKQVVLPEDNREDFDLLPDHVREGVSAVFVKTFDDVRKICFPD
ncbi:MAG: endopeptidase La [Desulfofustis sp. PB-SRB1]|jgi:ATP-dependent Lon protease|nr:endopeptidase La [Desulfofustis sp. PB-SRB1]MBM1001073.1 endopeptidase La [Desulfofustis sp. PB-SRB1]HBH28796.1 endopeptidase La [Desulfofustis sp.]HBH31028.1 endopeptidase La [Desulfofustis sp.]